MTTAFVLQLLALPGEKGQLVVAGLATRYPVAAVVAGATAAFGGWTVLEMLLGDALRGALPELFLDGATAGLFVVFAAWLLYTPQLDATDYAGRRDEGADAAAGPEDAPSSRAGGFVSSFSLLALGEVGDKTQLVTVGLAVQYGAHPGIWVGEMLAIVPVSVLTALLFSRTSARLDARWMRYAAAGLFVLFAADICAEYVLGTHLLPL